MYCVCVWSDARDAFYDAISGKIYASRALTAAVVTTKTVKLANPMYTVHKFPLHHRARCVVTEIA